MGGERWEGERNGDWLIRRGVTQRFKRLLLLEREGKEDQEDVQTSDAEHKGTCHPGGLIVLFCPSSHPVAALSLSKRPHLEKKSHSQFPRRPFCQAHTPPSPHLAAPHFGHTVFWPYCGPPNPFTDTPPAGPNSCFSANSTLTTQSPA